jgi:hypothetical protein
MPLSKTSNPRSKRQKLASETPPLREPPRHQRLPQYLNTNAQNQARTADKGYINGLTACERVEFILWQIYDQHRWSIKDLLRHIVTEESSVSAPTKDTRINNLSSAVLDQEDVIRAILYKAPSDRRLILMEIVAEVFVKEIDQLYTVPGLGKFNVNTAPKELNIHNITSRAKEVAPSLWQFLNRLVTTRYHGQTYPATKSFSGEFVAICAIMAHYRARQTSNSFQILLGVYLHSMGVKRRVISLLKGLGLTMSYTTVIDYVDQVATLSQVSITTIYIEKI